MELKEKMGEALQKLPDMHYMRINSNNKQHLDTGRILASNNQYDILQNLPLVSNNFT